jgi:hypothetical protein
MEKGEAADIVGTFAGAFVRSLFTRGDPGLLYWLTTPVGLAGLAIIGAICGFVYT